MQRTLRAAMEETTALVGFVDARALVCHALGVDRAHVLAHPMRMLTEAEDAIIDTLAAQRALGHPVAYLVGQREFYGRPFEVNSDVLIPRPETETLVEAALERMDRDKAGVVLDLGTGSGAVAVALACERPTWRFVATDASAAALAVAARNAERNGCLPRIEWLEGEWYAPVQGRAFDLIVSNPPYVAAGDGHLARGDLRFEPPAALTDGSPDGLGAIRAIVRGAKDHLRPGGWLVFEHGYDQADAIAALLDACAGVDRISLADFSGIPRVAGVRMT